MKIILAEQYGFCMGVKRAVRMASELSAKEIPLTIFHEIVHNETIVDYFRRRGISQASTIDEIADGTVIIPAHGAPPEVLKRAEQKGLKVIDATCPLVKRIHRLVARLTSEGYFIIHFGDKEHDETIGIAGHAGDNFKIIENYDDAREFDQDHRKLALTAQTTAGLQEFEKTAKYLTKKYPLLEVFNTICNATVRRQKAAAELAAKSDLFLVVGSETSANTKRLVEIASESCSHVFRINSAQEIEPVWLFDKKGPIETIGITAGASTPDKTVEEIIEAIDSMAGEPVEVVYPVSRDTDPGLIFEQ